MTSSPFYRDRYRAFLDRNGDLAPPWEQFPNYERYTIGWRMGVGEEWLSLWGLFLEGLNPSMATRLAYLRRHAPAPVNWADAVHSVLHPSLSDDESSADHDALAADRREALRELGLIASDVAYSTWRSQQHAVRWPWERSETPEEVARYRTREFWFWSRLIDALRDGPGWALPPMPDAWQPCESPLRTGYARSTDLTRGLLSLAQMFSAGRVTPPWRLDLAIDDFVDTFDDDMGFVDAFRLWGMTSFDDLEQLQRYLEATEAPEAWARWSIEHLFLEL